MPLAPDNFQILSPEQANPYGFGLQQGANTANTMAQTQNTNIQNQFLGQQLRQNILATQLQNEANQAKLPYAGPQAAATLAVTQAQPNLISAQANQANALAKMYPAQAAMDYAHAGFMNTQNNLLQQQTPGMVAHTNATVYTDPMAARAHQLAQQLGVPDQTLLGYGSSPTIIPPNQNNIATPSVPYGNKSQQLSGVIGQLPMTPQQTSTLQNTFGQTPQQADPNQVQATAALQNYIKYGSPLAPWVMEQLKHQYGTQGSTDVQNWNSTLKEADQKSQNANQLRDTVNQFSTNYDKSTYKGPFAGSFDSSGKSLLPLVGQATGQDLSPEQETDRAAKQMQTLLGNDIFRKGMTDKDLSFMSTYKLDRTMEPQAKQTLSDYFQTHAQRENEYQPMMLQARQAGLDPQTSQTLFNLYNNQRPAFDWYSGKPNQNFIGGWKDYLAPDVVNAVKNGQTPILPPTFTSKQQAQDWYKLLPTNMQAQYKYQIANQGGQK